MNLQQKINNSKNIFTKQDKKILEFLEDNPRDFKSESVHYLGKVTNTSPSAIIRFVRKLGYKSFMEMRMDIQENNNEIISNKLIIEKNDSMPKIIDILSSNYDITKNEVKGLVNIPQMKDIIKNLNKAEKIYLLGIGASGIVSLDLQEKLSRIGKTCMFNMDGHSQISLSTNITEMDAVIAFTYSGKTKEVNIALKHAKERGAYCVLVSQLSKQGIVKYADEICVLPLIESESGEIRMSAIMSRFAEFLYSDIFFLGLAQNNFDLAKKNFYEISSLLDEMKLS